VIGVLLGFALLTASPQAAEAPEVNAWTEPSSVLIGEPFTLALDVLHPEGQRVLLDAPPEGGDVFGDRWVVVEPRRVVRLPVGDGSGRTLTQARWRLIGLEPGEHELTTLGADAFVPGAVVRLEPALARVEVRGELASGEDAARPPAGFREPPSSSPRRWPGVLLAWVGLFGVAGLGVLGLVIARVRRSSGGAAPVRPLARLAELDPGDDDRRRELYYQVSQLVRAAFDGASGVRRDGLTDDEWGPVILEGQRFARPDVERASALLRSCAEVKYANARPTRFAAEALLTEARALIEAAERGASSGSSEVKA